MNRRMYILRMMAALGLLVAMLAACGSDRQETGSNLVPTAVVEAFVEEGEIEVGKPAPLFLLADSRGGVVDLRELRGKAVVVNFWADWCAPCRLEMPELQAAYEANHENGLEIIGVEIRASGAPEASAAFLNELGITFPTARDSQGLLQERYMKLQALPTTIFIDREGIVRYVQLGPMTKEFIEEQLDALGF